MFKFNKKELKEEIEIKKITLKQEKFFYEKGKKVKENEIEEYDSLAFSISAKDKSKEYGISFIIDYPEKLLKLPLNKKININEYINKSDAYWNLGIEKNYEEIEFQDINFYMTRYNDKDFIFEIIVNYEYQYFKSLETINYSMEIKFNFNYDNYIVEKEKNS